MSGNTTENLIYIGAAVLLPLIPAFILYKILPAKANLVGPLGKFTLKLSGAFAGYFALVIIVFGFVYSRPKPAAPCPEPPKERYMVYKVQGLIEPIVDGEDLIKDSNITLHPWMEISRSGLFELFVAVDQDSNAGVKSLEIMHEGFLPESIPLTDKLPDNITSNQKYPVKFDESTKTIYVQGRIKLVREDKPYSPARGQALVPVPSP